jgi:regulator of ribonuclease activity A
MHIATPTTDVVDARRDAARILNADWRLFTARTRFQGPARPIVLHGPDRALAEMLNSPGEGAVAVVSVLHDGPVAVFGDGMARAAEANGWAGVVIDGAVCDVALIRPRAIGVAARRAFPMFLRQGPAGSEADEAIIAGVRVARGDWIVVDEDGVVALDVETARKLAG